MLARAFNLTSNEKRAAQFTDADAIPAWAKGSVGAVAEAGYMTGYPDGSFGASGNITRAEAVVTADRAERAAAEKDTKKPASSGSSSGGTVTPPSQPDQPTTPAIEVAAIGTVAGIEVATGTLKTKEDAIAALPKQVVMMDVKNASIKDGNGANVLADVEWTFKGCTITSSGSATDTSGTEFRGTLEGGETQCVNTFTGKVTMPSGYTFTDNSSALTITTTITVKKADDTTLKTETIDSAAIADISQNLESYVSTDKVLEELTNQKLLPAKLSLYCDTQFVMTVDIPEDADWTAMNSGTSEKEGYAQYVLTPTFDWTEIEKKFPPAIN